MRKIAYTLFAVLAPVAAQAQTTLPIEPGAPTILLGSNFFVVLVSGILLAVAFQLLLTSLVSALGFNILATQTSPARPQGSQGEREHEGPQYPLQGIHNTIRSAVNWTGFLALLTASISLFFASWLATEFSYAATPLFGIILGLTIWGLFHVVMISLEATAISSLVGSLASAASSGMKTALGAAKSVFGKSPEDQIADASAQVVKSVRDELTRSGDIDRMRKGIQQYVNQLEPSQLSPEQIRKELKNLFDQTEIRAIASQPGPLMDHQMIIASLQTDGGTNKEKAESTARTVEDAFRSIQEEARSQKDMPSKAADAAMRAAGMSREEAESYRNKLENYLRSTGKSELNPEGIKHDLEDLVRDPKAGIQEIKSRLAGIDKSTVTAVLAQRGDMTRTEAEQAADKIDRVVSQIIGSKESTQESMKAASDRAVSKIRQFLNSLGNPELRYQWVEHDVRELFTNPRAGVEDLIEDVRSIDRDTLKRMLSYRKDITDEDAERIISRIEESRDKAVIKMEQLKKEAEIKMVQARQAIYRQIDQTRKTAAAASWWVFGTALVSGFAAAGGSLVAIATGV